MFQNRRAAAQTPAVDDFPVRPDAINQVEGATPNSPKSQTRTLVLFSLIYFLYGSGLSIYGPLYPSQARKIGIDSRIYGSVIASTYLVCVLFYPVSCRIVTSVSSRNSLSVSIFLIGACRILFGTLGLITGDFSFIAVSYGIQLVEGVGISLLIGATVVTAATRTYSQIWTLSIAIQSSLCLGLVLGPIGGRVVKEELGFDIVFYIIGGITVLSVILTATLQQEPEQPVTYEDVPIVYWIKDKRMLIYFLIVFASFNYVGFLSLSLDLLLPKFHLNNLHSSMMFSLPPFVYGLTATGWSWLIRKGVNNAMLIFIGSIVIIASLILIGPAPFTSLQPTMSYVCWALVFAGLGLACKCICVLDAAEKDLRYQRKHTDIQQKLIVPTIVLLGASFGYFTGSFISAFTNYYIGYKKGTIPFFALEVCTAAGAVVFAMNRNYVSKKRREATGESQPILNP